MRVLTIIPARSGSKRLPGKNWEKVGALDLIGHAVRVANACQWTPSIVTDAPEHCRNYFPASVATEPPELAGDDVPMGRVVQWTTEQAGIGSGDAVLLLQPTSPLRSERDVTTCIAMLGDGYDSVVSVSRRRNHATRNSVFECNGAIFAMRTDVALSGECVGGRVGLYAMPESRSIDIDTPEDLERAREMWARLHGS